MATNNSNFSLTQPQIPQFKGENYDFWSIKMKTLFSSQDLWDLIEIGYPVPVDQDTYTTWTQAQKDQLKDNKKKDSKALFLIQQAVHESIFPRIAAATKSKEAWDILQSAYQGTNKVKIVRLQMLRRDFENLSMKESESMQEFFTRVMGVVNQVRSHGETLSD